MYKKNAREAIERNKLYLQRKMNDGILFQTWNVERNPYVINEKRDGTWRTRDNCIVFTDKEWLMREAHGRLKVHQDIDDDKIPYDYPTGHLGESFYSAMLNAETIFQGSDYRNCSYAKPIIKNSDDLYKLKIDESNPLIQEFIKSASYFAKKAGGEFYLYYLITIDTMNLACELMGATEAYIAMYEDEYLIRKIMDFGVEFNIWFYELQKRIYRENNRKAMGNDELYELLDKTWYSVDSYNICDPEVYIDLGFEYQQRLINAVGGGLFHMHGTNIFGLLPKITKLKGIGYISVGLDGPQNREPLGVKDFKWFRETAEDIPLWIYLTVEEFTEGIKKRLLPGGTVYSCSVETVEEANRLAYMAKEYKP